jgi:hypothetical protein
MLKKYILALVLVFSFVITPVAFADTASELREQIKDVLAQIANLQNQIYASQKSVNSGGSGQTSVSVVTTSTSSTPRVTSTLPLR